MLNGYKWSYTTFEEQHFLKNYFLFILLPDTILFEKR